MRVAVLFAAALCVACAGPSVVVSPTPAFASPTPTVSSVASAPAAPTSSPTATPGPTPSPTATPTGGPTSGCGAAVPQLVWDAAAYGCTSAPIQPLPAPGTKLRPGIYTDPSFQPQVRFVVGKGWTHQQRAIGFFDIEDDPGSLDVVAVQFANVEGYGSADEAAADIAESSDLTTTFAETVDVDGHDALRFDVQTTDAVDADPPIFRPVINTTAGPLSIASGRRLQVTLLNVDQGVLAILVGGSIAEWDRALEMASPVVESVTIGN